MSVNGQSCTGLELSLAAFATGPRRLLHLHVRWRHEFGYGNDLFAIFFHFDFWAATGVPQPLTHAPTAIACRCALAECARVLHQAGSKLRLCLQMGLQPPRTPLTRATRRPGPRDVVGQPSLLVAMIVLRANVLYFVESGRFLGNSCPRVI